MAKLTGKNLYISYNSTALGDTYRSLEVTETQETADVTAGADDYRNFANTVKMIEATVEFIVKDYSNGGSAQLALLTLGGTAPLVWGAEGTATGMPKKGYMARLVETPVTLKFDDAYTIKAKFAMAGTAMLYNGVTDKW